MTSKVQGRLVLLSIVFVTALVGCGIGCSIAVRMMRDDPVDPISSSHQWFHQKLDLTPAQSKELEAAETQFAADRSKLSAALSTAKNTLGQIIKKDRTFTPRVTGAIEGIHHAMADLQKATVEHVFEMEESLTADQYDLLLEWAAESLRD